MTERPLTDAERAYLHHQHGGMTREDWELVAWRVAAIVAACWLVGLVVP